MKQIITHHLKNQNNNQHIHEMQTWLLTTKYENNKHDKLHRPNHENIKKLWRTVENTTRHQSDPIWHVINLSNILATFRHLNFSTEILILYPHLKYTININ